MKIVNLIVDEDDTKNERFVIEITEEELYLLINGLAAEISNYESDQGSFEYIVLREELKALIDA